MEYILVHELVHLHERHHVDRFRALTSEALPQWQAQREDELPRLITNVHTTVATTQDVICMGDISKALQPDICCLSSTSLMPAM